MGFVLILGRIIKIILKDIAGHVNGHSQQRQAGLGQDVFKVFLRRGRPRSRLNIYGWFCISYRTLFHWF